MYPSTMRRKALAGLFLLASIAVLICPGTGHAKTDPPGVKYSLRSLPDVPGGLEVKLSFKAESGKNAIIQPFVEGGDLESAFPGPSPSTEYEFQVQPGSGYTIEPLEGSPPSWRVVPASTGEITVTYGVVPAPPTGSQTQPGAVDGVEPLLSEGQPDLAALEGSQAFLVPLTEIEREPLSSEFEVLFDAAEGETELSPWPSSDQQGAYRISGVENLSFNYLALGAIDLVQEKAGSTGLRIGFAKGYGLDGEQRGAYASGLSEIFGRLSDVLGKRQDLEVASVLMIGSARETAGIPRETLMSSIAQSNGGGELEGDPAYDASSRMFDLWNRWSLIPARGGNAAWFQEGMSVLYPYRVACAAGRYSADRASRALSSLYLQSQTGPYASLTLVEAEQQGFSEFLQQKGAVVCAAIDKRLVTLTNGEKDLDWLLGELAKKYDHFEGHDYDLEDIEETLEDGSGKSWGRSLEKWVETADPIYSSDFSQVEFFTEGQTGPTAGSFQGKTSTRNWLLLLVAVLVVFSIPIVFSSYVRRAIKLDITMPKIIPDDEDEEVEEEEDD